LTLGSEIPRVCALLTKRQPLSDWPELRQGGLVLGKHDYWLLPHRNVNSRTRRRRVGGDDDLCRSRCLYDGSLGFETASGGEAADNDGNNGDKLHDEPSLGRMVNGQ
jgi:hypothetical protein